MAVGVGAEARPAAAQPDSGGQVGGYQATHQKSPAAKSNSSS